MARKRIERREPRFGPPDPDIVWHSPEERIAPARRGGKARPARAARGRRRGSWLLALVKLGFGATLVGVVALAGVIGFFAMQLPPIDSLTVPKRPPNVAVLAAGGELIANRGEAGGQEIRLRDLPRYVGDAFIAVEDRRFRQHFGIDPWGLGRAMAVNLAAGRLEQGGSTLTQQLAKNIYLGPERSIERKGKEAVLALWLERKFSKDEILELYLNRVYFGAGAYGIEGASRTYFAKSARDLTLAEAAMLAGLVRAPSRLAPNRNLAAARERAALVLGMMREQGLVGEESYRMALAEPATARKRATDGPAQYAADWAMDLMDDYLGAFEGDVVVRTTIDLSLQREAEAALRTTLDAKGQRFRVRQGAIVTLAPDGAIRALVGGRSYAASQFNRAIAARRQPGSAFKPFVFLAALENGYTPQGIVRDEPFRHGDWAPENYRRGYAGDVTLTTALAKSLNVPAAKLAIEAGPRRVMRTAQRLGIASALNDSPAIALGAAEVTPLELTAAYAPFANGGRGVVPFLIESISTSGGRRLFERRDPGFSQVAPPDQVRMMNAMMREVVRGGTARRAVVPGWEPAGKTGTSQRFRDAWFIGYTPHAVTGVWLGNDDGAPTRRLTGSDLPVEIWSRVMKAAHAGAAPVALDTAWSGEATAAIAPAPPAGDAAEGDAAEGDAAEGMALMVDAGPNGAEDGEIGAPISLSPSQP
jgi:penicillin-binding protein 1A